MRKLILLCVVFLTAPSFANVTVEQAETAMHAAEQDKSKLVDAEVLLRDAVKENPNSYKANFYLSQILKQTGEPDAEVYAKKAKNIESDAARSAVKSFVLFALTLLAIVVGGLWGYQFYQKHRDEEQERLILEKQSSQFSRRFVDAQRELQNIVIHLELCDVKFNNKIYSDIDDLKSAICDIVERITEGHGWTTYEAENLLEEVSSSIRYCKEKFK